MRTIRELREARGWSQADLARALGVNQMTVWKWEAGRFMPSALQLRALARAFGISMDDIDFEGPTRGKDAA